MKDEGAREFESVRQGQEPGQVAGPASANMSTPSRTVRATLEVVPRYSPDKSQVSDNL